MILLRYHLCLTDFYQIPNFFDNSDKTGNLKYYWPVISLNCNEKLRRKEYVLNWVTGGPMSIKKLFIYSSINIITLKPNSLEMSRSIHKVLSGYAVQIYENGSRCLVYSCKMPASGRIKSQALF